jgi:serine/threonine protein kinase
MVTELHAGDVLEGCFAIAELIDHGGMGSVFKATDLSNGGLVAVKIFFEVERDPVRLSRFQREIEIARGLDHPGILKILVVDNTRRPCLVTDRTPTHSRCGA